MTATLDQSVLESLRRYDTPTVANAIETFNVRPRNEGFASPEIRSVFPDLPAMVGYAVTAKIRSAHPATEQYARRSWWEYILTTPSPRVVVFEDIDETPGFGAYWGEVNSNIHRALGCLGVVTNGAVRDLQEAHDVPFQYFASHIGASHAYVHIVEVGGPVSIGGLPIETGNVIHADRHGVLTVPLEVATKIPEAAERLLVQERSVVKLCRSNKFTLDGLAQLLSTGG